MTDSIAHSTAPASFTRRLMASLYDWLLVLATMMVLSTPVIAILNDAINPGNPYYRMAMALTALLFFSSFWHFGGQTLGMRAWHLRLRAADGGAVSWRMAFTRFGCACISALPAGMGFWWMLFDSQGLSWHDRWSGTRLRLEPKRTR